MRDDLNPEVRDADLRRALSSVSVVLEADEATLRNASAQHAFVTTALLAIRSGARVHVDAPDVELRGIHAPLHGDRLIAALTNADNSIVPGLSFSIGVPNREPALAIVFGQTPHRSPAFRAIRLSADAWSGTISRVDARVSSFESESPFGALAAAGLAAVEIYKTAMRELRRFAKVPSVFDDFFGETNQATIHIAPQGTPSPPMDLGTFDCISGGAITHSALYALGRIPNAVGRIRVIEPQTADITNLNRYALLTTSGIGVLKATDLSRSGLGKLAIEAVTLRYEPATRAQLDPLASTILVGVDDIPTRWLVQSAAPKSWIGVGATSHYMAMTSAHHPGLPCVRCVHPRDDPGPELIPTVAWVSHWAGLWTAAMLVQHRLGLDVNPRTQVTCASLLVPSGPRAIWRGGGGPKADCPNGCMRFDKP